MNSSLYQTPALVIVAVLFVSMIAFNHAGFYFRQWEVKKFPDNKFKGLGPTEGTLLGLLALLLSFTFSMSAGKNDTRREIIVEEANDIGTAILRCDMYPDSNRKELHGLFANYINARIAYYDAGVDTTKINQSLRLTNVASAKIWKKVAALSQDKDNVLRSQQMIPAVNAMIDMVSTRDAARSAHVPGSILWMLFLLTIAGSFIMGYGSNGKHFNKIIVGGFALMTVMTIYLILDLDRPRRGIINMDNVEARIVALKEMVK